jgi:aminopeptidase C
MDSLLTRVLAEAGNVSREWAFKLYTPRGSGISYQSLMAQLSEYGVIPYWSTNEQRESYGSKLHTSLVMISSWLDRHYY